MKNFFYIPFVLITDGFVYLQTKLKENSEKTNLLKGIILGFLVIFAIYLYTNFLITFIFAFISFFVLLVVNEMRTRPLLPGLMLANIIVFVFIILLLPFEDISYTRLGKVSINKEDILIGAIKIVDKNNSYIIKEGLKEGTYNVVRVIRRIPIIAEDDIISTVEIDFNREMIDKKDLKPKELEPKVL